MEKLKTKQKKTMNSLGRDFVFPPLVPPLQLDNNNENKSCLNELQF